MQLEVAHKRVPLERRKKRKHPGEEHAADGGDAAAVAPAAAAAPTAPSSKQQKQRQQQQQQQRAKRPKPSAAAEAAAKAAAAVKHKLTRAVAVGALTPAAVAPALSLAREAGKVVEVVQPAPPELCERLHLAADGCSGDVVLVVYETVSVPRASLVVCETRCMCPHASWGLPPPQVLGHRG